eukprot:PhM_4_TR5317/c0_g1_i1/m.81888
MDRLPDSVLFALQAARRVPQPDSFDISSDAKPTPVTRTVITSLSGAPSADISGVDDLDHHFRRARSTLDTQLDAVLSDVPLGTYRLGGGGGGHTENNNYRSQSQISSAMAPAAELRSGSSHLDIAGLPMSLYERLEQDPLYSKALQESEEAFFRRDFTPADGVIFTSTPLQPEFPSEEPSSITVREFLATARMAEPNSDKERSTASNAMAWNSYLHSRHTERIKERGLDVPEEESRGGVGGAAAMDDRQELNVEYREVLPGQQCYDPFVDFRWWEHQDDVAYLEENCGVKSSGTSNEGIPMFVDGFGNATYGLYAAHPLRTWMLSYFTMKGEATAAYASQIDTLLYNNIANPLGLQLELIRQFGAEPGCEAFTEHYKFAYPPDSGVDFELKGDGGGGGGDGADSPDGEKKKKKDKKKKKKKGEEGEAAADADDGDIVATSETQEKKKKKKKKKDKELNDDDAE